MDKGKYLMCLKSYNLLDRDWNFIDFMQLNGIL